MIKQPYGDPIADVLHVHEALSPMPSGAMRWKPTKEGYEVLDRYWYMGLKEDGFEYILRPYEKGTEDEVSQECRWLATMVEGKPSSYDLYRRHISTFIRNGGEVGYENNQFYVSYYQ